LRQMKRGLDEEMVSTKNPPKNEDIRREDEWEREKEREQIA